MVQLLRKRLLIERAHAQFPDLRPLARPALLRAGCYYRLSNKKSSAILQKRPVRRRGGGMVMPALKQFTRPRLLCPFLLRIKTEHLQKGRFINDRHTQLVRLITFCSAP